jgi:hypothetical protein
MERLLAVDFRNLYLDSLAQTWRASSSLAMAVAGWSERSAGKRSDSRCGLADPTKSYKMTSTEAAEEVHARALISSGRKSRPLANLHRRSDPKEARSCDRG